MNKTFTFLGLFIALSLLSFSDAYSQATGFTDELYVSGINKGVGFVSDPTGRFFVWEQDGKIWTITNGIKSSTPLLDITAEVVPSVQMGLIGVVLDPDFLNNGYIYLYYSVDVYWEQNHNSSNYNTSQLDWGGDYLPHAAFGRLTRYTVTNLVNSFPTINTNSRLVLLGETLQTGVPSTAFAHIGGAMAFGQDGTLILATGDGASSGDGQAYGDTGSYATWSAYVEALQLGIMTNSENIGSLRSQLNTSLSGKILRLDPATGNGIPSNPNYNSSTPRSVQSRTWGKGMRNPFRMTFKPESGSHYPADANPGVFWLVDVGRAEKEEVELVTASGQNFGWPVYEGINYQSTWVTGWSIPNNEYRRPLIDYRNSQGRTWYNNNHIEMIGGSTVTGTNYMEGDCSIGGIFYNKTDFPTQYQNSVYTADFDSRWIWQAKLDANNNLVSLNNFYQVPDKITYLDVSPTMDGLFYLSGAGSVNTQLRRIRYNAGNQPPVVIFTANPTYGTGSVNVAFNALNSYDPEGGNITYAWDFGDGSSTSGTYNPSHTFTSASITKFKVKVTVTDQLGASKTDSVYISLNNTPPVINSTSLDNITSQGVGQAIPITLTANATDAEQPNQLTYDWVIVLAHNGHEHVESQLSGNNVFVNIPPTACETGEATYWQRVYLTVTDPLGLSTKTYRDIFPSCGNASQTITFPPISDKTTSSAPFQVSATATSGMVTNYFILQGPANVIGNTISLTGVPGLVKVRAVQHGGNGYDPAKPVDVAFYVNNATSTTLSATLTASIVSSSSVQLSWIFPSGNYVSYNILKDGTTIGTVSGSTLTYLVSNLPSNISFKFTIVGVDAAGNKTYSQNIFVILPTITCSTGGTYLSSLNWTSSTNGWGPVEKDKSNGEDQANDGSVLTINGVTYAKGLGTHAASEINYTLSGSFNRLVSDVGLDDEVNNPNCGNVIFKIYKNGTLAYQSAAMTPTDPAAHIDIDISGTTQLKLVVDPNGVIYCDHADWAGIKILQCNTDLIPPSTVTNFSLTNVTASSSTLNWWPATDNIGVVGYEVYLNGVLYGSVTSTNISIIGLTNNSVVVVQAKDAAGNTSSSQIVDLSQLQCEQVVTLISSINDYLSGAIKSIKTNQTIVATNKIFAGANVTYEALKSITLSPGFKVESGSVFKASIAGCN